MENSKGYVSLIFFEKFALKAVIDKVSEETGYTLKLFRNSRSVIRIESDTPLDEEWARKYLSEAGNITEVRVMKYTDNIDDLVSRTPTASEFDFIQKKTYGKGKNSNLPVPFICAILIMVGTIVMVKGGNPAVGAALVVICIGLLALTLTANKKTKLMLDEFDPTPWIAIEGFAANTWSEAVDVEGRPTDETIGHIEFGQDTWTLNQNLTKYRQIGDRIVLFYNRETKKFI